MVVKLISAFLVFNSLFFPPLAHANAHKCALFLNAIRHLSHTPLKPLRAAEILDLREAVINKLMPRVRHNAHIPLDVAAKAPAALTAFALDSDRLQEGIPYDFVTFSHNLLDYFAEEVATDSNKSAAFVTSDPRLIRFILKSLTWTVSDEAQRWINPSIRTAVATKAVLKGHLEAIFTGVAYTVLPIVNTFTLLPCLALFEFIKEWVIANNIMLRPDAENAAFTGAVLTSIRLGTLMAYHLMDHPLETLLEEHLFGKPQAPEAPLDLTSPFWNEGAVKLIQKYMPPFVEKVKARDGFEEYKRPKRVSQDWWLNLSLSDSQDGVHVSVYINGGKLYLLTGTRHLPREGEDAEITKTSK